MTEAEDEELIRQSKVVGLIYDPPQKGFPHLAVIFIDGNLVLCESVGSVKEGEALIEGVLPEIPEMIRKVRQKARRRDAKH